MARFFGVFPGTTLETLAPDTPMLEVRELGPSGFFQAPGALARRRVGTSLPVPQLRVLSLVQRCAGSC